MSDSDLQQPLFVVCTGRCGSTLLSNLLNLNPRLLSLSELFVFLLPEPWPRGELTADDFWRVIASPRYWVDEMLRKGVGIEEMLYRPGPGRRYDLETGIPGIAITALPHLTDDPDALFDRIYQFVMTLEPAAAARQYELLFHWMKQELGRELWVERSGSSLTYLPRLMAQFPDARYIHLYRDGRETAISMSRHNAFRIGSLGGAMRAFLGVNPFQSEQRPPRLDLPPSLRPFLPENFDLQAYLDREIPPETYGLAWNAEIVNGMGMLMTRALDRTLQVRYENLVANPRAELVNICRFMGLDEDPEAEWLDRAAALPKVLPPRLTTLPPEQQERLNRACAPGMAMLYGSPRPELTRTADGDGFASR